MNFLELEFKLPLICCLFMSLICIIYNSKKKVKIFENRFFDVILYSSTAYSFLNFVVYFITSFVTTEELNSTFHDLMLWMNIFLVLLLVAICLSLLLYNFSISYKEKLTNKKVNLIYMVVLLSFFVISLFLDASFSHEYSITQVHGSLVDFSYYVVGFLILTTFIFAFANKKKIGSRFKTIIYMLLFLAPIVGFSYFVPGLILQDVLPVLLTYIMYFTMENPDIKLVHQISEEKIKAEKANRAKSDFLSSMSHEIRTPLNAIVGFANIMRDDPELPQKFVEETTDIVNASSTLLEIVGNILDISKIETNKLTLSEAPYNFKEVVDLTVKLNKTRINDKDLIITCKIAPDIPYEVIGDKSYVKSILNNLVSNAVKYTKQGVVDVKISCINEGDISNLIVSVADTGSGIKKEDISKLFTRFERLDRNTTVEGTGLGLAITKNLVELMGGKINVQSNYGQGSLFIVNIPQKISKMEETIVNNEVKELETVTELSTNNKKLLLVDDNKLNIKVAKRVLENFGVIIDECYDGLQCLEKVKENKYDVILMDIMMPNMSGETAIEHLKEDPNFNTPVIALTADAVTGARDQYLKQGFVGYLSKPFNKDALKEELEKCFKK